MSCWCSPGGAGWGADELDQAIGSSRIADRIVRTGYVPDDTVPALLRSSVGAVYPALYEGFGLPALEALACGTPLVTSVGTAMEEVAGDAALLVEPGDPPALADALDLLLTQGRDRSSLVEERRERGFRIVERHTWAASASKHVAAYRSAAGLAPLAGGGSRSGDGSGRGPAPGATPDLAVLPPQPVG